MIPPTTLILFNLFACIAGISRTVQSSDPRWGEPNVAAGSNCKSRKLLQQQSRHVGLGRLLAKMRGPLSINEFHPLVLFIACGKESRNLILLDHLPHFFVAGQLMGSLFFSIWVLLHLYPFAKVRQGANLSRRDS
jgi:hypothetical protein